MLPRKSFIVRILALFLFACLLLVLWIGSPTDKSETTFAQQFLNGRNSLKKEINQAVNAENSKNVELFHDKSARNVLKSATKTGADSPVMPINLVTPSVDNDEENTTAMTSEELELISEHDGYVNISSEELKLALTENIVNPHDFNVVINNKYVCNRRHIFLIIYIHSAPDHSQRRIAIRNTWGNPSTYRNLAVRTVFMIGKTNSANVQKSIVLENNIYRDIVQEDYVDSYKNLTYKGVQGLRWISNHCAHAAYVLKTDDDIFVNTYSLINHLQSLRRHGIALSNTILCNVWTTMVVMRDKKSKWYVSKDEFKEDMYPTYCSGSAYLFTTDLIPKMYLASKTTKFFWVDDFYITGLLAQKVNASFHNLNSLYVLNANTVVKEFTGGDNWTWVFGHLHGLDKMYFVWKKITEKFRNVLPF